MDLVVRVDTPAAPGETVFGRSFATVAGGKGLNQAVAAARAAGRVEFIGCVGRDAFGEDLIAVMDAEGIARPLLRRVPTPTGTAHITVDANGQNSIIVVAGANGDATADDVTDEVAGRLDWLVTQLELPQPAVAAALARAHRRGVRTCLTPAPATPLGEDLLRTVDLLVPNEIEAAVLAGESDPATAAARLSLLCSDVVVTMGGDGAVWARGGVVVRHVPARPVEVIDTTAAGDTFVGVLVVELSRGAGFPAALQAATIAASLSVGQEGATASMPRRSQIDAVLKGLGEHVR
jgi:ribokinase